MASPEVNVTPPPRVDILGVGVHALDMPLALRLIEERLRTGAKGYVCATDVNAIMAAQEDNAFKEILNTSFLTTPDGMPLVWLGRLAGHASMDRVYGPDLMLSVCELSVTSGYTHYLYGGGEGVAEELGQVLRNRFPGLRVVGAHTPPFRPLTAAERKALQDEVARLSPDIFWVGLGAPKQERFMAEFLPELDTRLMLGVGAAFDFHTGRQKEAPAWMKRAGLQWFHRLCHEPRRLGRRYLVNNPRFILALVRQSLRRGALR